MAFKKNVERRGIQKVLNDPGGHSIEIEIKQNGNLVYSNLLVCQGTRKNRVEYKTRLGDIIRRGSMVDIKSLVKSVL